MLPESWDPLKADLAELKTYDAAPESVERIRACCLARLAAHRRKQHVRPSRPVLRWRWLETALAIGLSAVYLAAAFVSSLALLH